LHTRLLCYCPLHWDVRRGCVEPAAFVAPNRRVRAQASVLLVDGIAEQRLRSAVAVEVFKELTLPFGVEHIVVRCTIIVNWAPVKSNSRPRWLVRVWRDGGSQVRPPRCVLRPGKYYAAILIPFVANILHFAASCLRLCCKSQHTIFFRGLFCVLLKIRYKLQHLPVLRIATNIIAAVMLQFATTNCCNLQLQQK